ncbi:MAG TPA: carbon-nitrogen hydrolase family protein [Nakamurella sp.]
MRIAVVQAAYELMDRAATLDRTVHLIGEAAQGGAGLIAFPEVFIPGTPIWIDSAPIWEGDAQWYALLCDQAVVIPGPVTDAIGAAARAAGVYVVIGVDEREPHGATIFNTTCYFGPDGALLARHRKLVPTGSERTVWGMGDGSTLPVVDTPFGRVSGLTCWENYMPLVRFHLYAQGVDLWIAPTLAGGDAWIATMRHIAREGRCYVVGVNPCLRADQIPATFPDRERVWRRDRPDGDWVEPGNSVIVDPNGAVLAGPSRHEETILWADLDPAEVRAARRFFDPAGHYHRPDIFQLTVDTRPRPAVTVIGPGSGSLVPAPARHSRGDRDQPTGDGAPTTGT